MKDSDKQTLVKHLSLLRKPSIKPLFAAEAAILHRLLYKNKNQHKSAKYMHHSAQVARLVRKWQKCDSDICAFVQRVLDSLRIANPKKYKPSPTDSPPDILALATLITRLATSCEISAALMSASTAAYSSFKCVAAQSYFLPLSLTAMGVLARIRYCAATSQSDIESAYSALLALATRALKVGRVVDADGRFVVDLGTLEKDFAVRSGGAVVDECMNDMSILSQDSALVYTPRHNPAPSTTTQEFFVAESLAPELDLFSPKTVEKGANNVEVGKIEKAPKVEKVEILENEDVSIISTVELLKKRKLGAVGRDEKILNDGVRVKKEKKIKKPKLQKDEIDDIFG